MRYYETSACRTCPLKPHCTRNKENRRITRAEYEGALDRMQARREHPEIVKLRQPLAEHPSHVETGVQSGLLLVTRVRQSESRDELERVGLQLEAGDQHLGCAEVARSPESQGRDLARPLVASLLVAHLQFAELLPEGFDTV